MKKQKFTPWFPAGTNPTRAGVYETIGSFCERFFQYWNGRFWGYYANSMHGAKKYRNYKSKVQFPVWRGLAVKP